MLDSRDEANKIKVRFWGVRGSIPSPGKHTVRYGGNTSCVSIEGTNLVDGTRRMGILDCGTGIRELGKALLDDPAELILFLTHTHWDHIQGFPFFLPLFQPNRNIYLSMNEERRGLFRQLLEQMDGTHFPLTQEQIKSDIESYTLMELQAFAAQGYHISRIRTNHPGETYGFCADLRDIRVVYIPDNELTPPGEPRTTKAKFAEFCQDAELLIHDAQYLPEDMPMKHGWGHSLISDVWELAVAANVQHLVLFHHDPDRTDDALDKINADSQAYFAQHAPHIRCTVAYEGLEILF